VLGSIDVYLLPTAVATLVVWFLWRRGRERS